MAAAPRHRIESGLYRTGPRSAALSPAPRGQMVWSDPPPTRPLHRLADGILRADNESAPTNDDVSMVVFEDGMITLTPHQSCDYRLLGTLVKLVMPEKIKAGSTGLQT